MSSSGIPLQPQAQFLSSGGGPLPGDPAHVEMVQSLRAAAVNTGRPAEAVVELNILNKLASFYLC